MSEWREHTLGEIADHIERHHHAFLREMLSRLESLESAAREGADEKTARAVDALDGILEPFAIELEHHLMTEESAVFPLVRESGGPDRAAVIEQVVKHLATEHASALAALGEIRSLTSDFTTPAGSSAALRDLYEALSELDSDLREHIHLENDVLFPRASRPKGGFAETGET